MRHQAGGSNLSEVRDTLCAMPRKSEFDTRRLNRILQEQHSVISRAQVFSCGMFNAQLFDADGTFIAMVDAWWQDSGVAAEIDSRAYHLSAEDQDRTTERHDRLVAHGILPLHFPRKRLRTDPAGVISEIRRAIENGRRRSPLPVKGLPAAWLA
jgi:very-short-patch-repair endonuclease